MSKLARNRKWMAAVASLETCVLCGAWGVQVAHRNQGRGKGQKNRDELTAALCPDCHWAIDNGNKLTREERRAQMDCAIVRTFERLLEAGRISVA